MKQSITLLDLHTGKQYQAVLPAVIGRSRNADILLNDPGVSRRHARIEAWDNACKIVDLNSSNGVFVNGQRISSAAIVNTGDILGLGNSRLKITGDKQHAGNGTETVILHSTPLEDKLHVDAQRLQVLYEMAVTISEHQSVDELLEGFFGSISKIIRFDRHFLVTLDDSGACQ